MATGQDKIHDIVTDRIVELLDAGVVPWRRPWRTTELPKSFAYKRPYNGINVLLLKYAADLHGYNSPYWTTFNQCRAKGGTVRKGEKSSMVFLWKPFKKTSPNKDTGEPETSTFFTLRYFNVFNTDQCDGLDVTLPEAVEHDTLEAAERVVEAYQSHGGCPLKFGGDRAFYDPRGDYCQVPDRGRFENIEEFYNTVFHEYGHSTGHASRLNRKGIAEFNGLDHDKYSREELVAEMTAAFLCGTTGVDGTLEGSAAYIESWKRKLKDDKRLLMTAASQADKAARFIRGEHDSQIESEAA